VHRDFLINLHKYPKFDVLLRITMRTAAFWDVIKGTKFIGYTASHSGKLNGGNNPM